MANQSGEEKRAFITYKGLRKFTDLSGSGWTVAGQGEVSLLLPGCTVMVLKAEVEL